MKAMVSLLVLALALAACGSEDTPEAVTPSVDEEQGVFADYFDDGGYILPNSHGLIIREISFFGQEEDGTLEGFDLDDKNSDDSDEASCGHADLADTSGNTGIDNQVGAIWNAPLEPLVGEATYALLNGAINEGRFLMAMELTGVDDLKNDDNVALRFFRATADPYVGTFGFIAPDQTYHVDTEFPSTTIENLQIVDGEVVAGPVEFQIPIDVLNEFFIVRVTTGKVRFTIAEDGSASGFLGGVINVADVLEEGYQTNAAQEFRVVTPFFFANTDMLPNDEGGCDGISMAIRIEATTGFVVHYDENGPAR